MCLGWNKTEKQKKTFQSLVLPDLVNILLSKEVTVPGSQFPNCNTASWEIVESHYRRVRRKEYNPKSHRQARRYLSWGKKFVFVRIQRLYHSNT